MNILLISDNNEFAEKLKEKLVFLRKDDVINIANYGDDFPTSDVILVHDNSVDTLNLIENLRKFQNLCIILITDSYDRRLILSAVDIGIDDFILANAGNFEFVIRIVRSMKQISVKKLAYRNFEMLKQSNIVDEFSGFYRYEYSRMLLNDYKSGTFMALTPCDKTEFSEEKIADAIKSTLRMSDIAFWGDGAIFYVFLVETDYNGAVTVFNKINSIISVKGGFSDILHKNFEKEALNYMSKAKDGEYLFGETEENTLDEWLLDASSGGYKLFRKVFNNKLEKVIAPVFYRLQKSYETKLQDTEIEQQVDMEQCIFSLKNKTNKSSLRIVYPGFAKIMIYVEHEGLDSPENKEIALQLDKITQKELISIVEGFIGEFKEAKCYR